MNSSTGKRKTILFLAANPKNSTSLDLTREVKEIEAGLERSQKRDRFLLKQVWAITPADVQRAMLDHKPQIVHFSGHGMGEGGLVLENVVGQAQLVQSGALAGLFELFADNVECVVLNACYSEVQALAIAHHIPYVVGMSQTVGDRAARAFAVGFYDALGAGKSIDFAYKLGCNRIALEGIPEDLIPTLKKGMIKTPALIEESVESEQIDLDNPEDQVALDSGFYIERHEIEKKCNEIIAKSRALIRIKAPHQMGKSSLMLRILKYASKEKGYKTVVVNFQRSEQESLTNFEHLLQWFCAFITSELELDDKIADYWNERLGIKNKCTNYFERYLLPTIQTPLVLFLDNVDWIFPSEAIAVDFFSLLRSWHDATEKAIWANLRLVIVHSKEVYIPLKKNQSPFNVGVPVELPQFNAIQVMDLAQRHKLDWSLQEASRLMTMVGGHPYLVRVALYRIARGEMTLDRILSVAPTEGGIYGSHLRRHLLNLEGDERLIAAMKRVVMADQPVSISASEAFKLTSMGLVHFQDQDNDVVPTCELYRYYFRSRWEVGK